MTSVFSDILSRAFAAPASMAPDAWADRNRFLPAVGTDKPGRYSCDTTPYIRRPLRLFAASQCRYITLMFATQLGKTELVETLKLFTVACDPAPTIVMAPNIDMARDLNRDRFIPAIESTPSVAAHLTGFAQDVKNLKIAFDNMTMWFIGSNSKAQRRSRPARIIFADEIGAYEDAEWVEVFDRVKSFTNSKVVCTSTPSGEMQGIDELFHQGSQETFHVPCPYCGTRQELVFDRLRWDGGGSATPTHVAETAHYACSHCDGKIYNHHKPTMLMGGRWMTPEGAAADELPPPKHASFHLSSLYSPFGRATFGDMAYEYAASNFRMTPRFVTGWLGKPWSVIRDRVDTGDLRALAAKSDYSIGTVHPNVKGVTFAADVQQDRVYVEVRGWGVGGADTWLIDRLCIDRVEGRGLIELNDLIQRLASSPIPPAIYGIDSGDFTSEVYGYVRTLVNRGIPAVAIKGQNRSGMRAPHSLTRLDKWPDGKPMPGGCSLLVVNSDVWKRALAGRIKGRTTDEGTVPVFGVPRNTDGCLEEWFDHMTSEAFTQRKIPGGYAYEWKTVAGRSANHWWDAAYYNLALADYRGVRMLGA